MFFLSDHSIKVWMGSEFSSPYLQEGVSEGSDLMVTFFCYLSIYLGHFPQFGG